MPDDFWCDLFYNKLLFCLFVAVVDDEINDLFVIDIGVGNKLLFKLVPLFVDLLLKLIDDDIWFSFKS